MADASLYGVTTSVLRWPKCWRCGRTLAEYLTAPFSMRCRKCHAENRAGPDCSTGRVVASSATT